MAIRRLPSTCVGRSPNGRFPRVISVKSLGASPGLLVTLLLAAGCGGQSQNGGRESTSNDSRGRADGGTDAAVFGPVGDNSSAPNGGTGATGFSAPSGTATPAGASGATGGSTGGVVRGPTAAFGCSGPAGSAGCGPGHTGASGGGGVLGPTGSGATSSGPSGGSGPWGNTGTVGSSGSSGAFGPSGAGSSGALDAGTPTLDSGTIALAEPWEEGDECAPDAASGCADMPAVNRYSAIGGSNLMPTINWSKGPEATQSYAITFQDLADGNVHWAMWNIPASELSIGPDNLPNEASQAALVGLSWLGPDACNSPYELAVYALSEASVAVQSNTALEAYTLLSADDGLVLSKDFVRVTPHAPCGE